MGRPPEMGLLEDSDFRAMLRVVTLLAGGTALGFAVADLGNGAVIEGVPKALVGLAVCAAALWDNPFAAVVRSAKRPVALRCLAYGPIALPAGAFVLRGWGVAWLGWYDWGWQGATIGCGLLLHCYLLRPRGQRKRKGASWGKRAMERRLGRMRSDFADGAREVVGAWLLSLMLTEGASLVGMNVGLASLLLLAAVLAPPVLRAVRVRRLAHHHPDNG